MTITPCKDCPDRHPVCHDTCPKYAEFKRQRGLTPLTPTNIVEPEIIYYKNGKGSDSRWHIDTIRLPPTERSKARSKTFPGIAKAMAEQWG